VAGFDPPADKLVARLINQAASAPHRPNSCSADAARQQLFPDILAHRHFFELPVSSIMRQQAFKTYFKNLLHDKLILLSSASFADRATTSIQTGRKKLLKSG
jgi:hypothetical protein